MSRLIKAGGLLVPQTEEEALLEPYYGSLGSLYKPLSRTGYTVLSVCEYLIGGTWGLLSYGALQSLNPVFLRVTKGEIKCSAMPGRVTVYVNDSNVITKIEQEATVGLPDGVNHGHHLSQLLKINA